MWFLLACTTGNPDTAGPELPEEVVLGARKTCESPTKGWDRFSPRGPETQLPVETNQGGCPYLRNGLVAQDLDGDGDPDVVLHRSEGPLLLRNDGGELVEVDPGLTWERDVHVTSAVDLDGDGLSELVSVGPDLVLIGWNLGGLEFAPWEAILDSPAYPNTCHVSLSWVDVDNDGDLDLSLPSCDVVPYADYIMPSEGGWIAGSDKLYRNDGDSWTKLNAPNPAEGPGLSLMHIWTDFDQDGDRDLIAGTDRIFDPSFPPMQFYEKDQGRFEDIAAETGFDLRVDAMGFDSVDMNFDGVMDYCVSDFGNSVICLLSASDGSWFEAGDARGLTVDLGSYPYTPASYDAESDDEMETVWVTWAVAIADLDNDGAEDMLVSAGPVPDQGIVLGSPMHDWQPTAVFAGRHEVDGLYFDEVSVETGIGEASTGYDYALVDADLDGDGYREVLRTSHSEPLQIWDNPCGDGHWLEVDLVGLAGNRQAFGARVEVDSGGVTHVREVHSVSLISQPPPTLHFGLAGDVEALRVTFPDGATVETEGFKARRQVTINHPDR